jgi:hypothetical protein
MYQLLITTKTMGTASVHTIVATFTSRGDATRAADIINSQKLYGIVQTALELF